MPTDRAPPLDRRPDYFTPFDRWLRQLERHIPDPATRASILTVLDEDGRQVDVQQLAVQHSLSRATVRLIRRLVRFGDEGGPVHCFASVCIAEVAPRGKSQSVVTFVFATRRGATIDYWWTDSAEGFGSLGIRNTSLTLREAVVMVTRVVRAQANYNIVDGGDRTSYLRDHAAQLRIRSPFYLQLGAKCRSSWRRRAHGMGRRW